ncbi:DUF6519 domain-containing protein [Streptomyces sp. NPDC001652]|uniref:DUF6519 domain-containing protein n=1 Tax=Streptomyces sp. NPDC001652 TaxID=3154393 RepID=UPI003330530D
MGADISRVGFDPRRDIAGVLLQQGRLLLDGDFNELVALLDRRLRAHAVDLTSYGPDSGPTGGAWVPRETPDGFKVSVSGHRLVIGRGRMYVDGLLAENHGTKPQGYDPRLSETVGTSDMTYEEQPYWPVRDALPTGGRHLVYLDVWRREVTHVEDPELVEQAVGVDTTARWQTVWQVRVLRDVGGMTCGTKDADIKGWAELVRPSQGRLTTGSVTVPEAEDPCRLPPTGGYRGLENQTYRVEVHTEGPPGTATFRWSRENASVVLPVVEWISPTKLRVASVGKDDVLRVSTGDWVEVLDDRYELGLKPGQMRKVTVDDATRTLTFASGLPGDLRPPGPGDPDDWHLRVRRWDQSGVVRDAEGNQLTDLGAANSTGLITVPADPAAQVVLEHGVAVSFSVAAPNGRFRSGDHWIFAARTADTSVEKLVAAPPLGVHHHYARLGVLTAPNGDAATDLDCRRLWPPVATTTDTCGDCTVCVTAASHADGTLTVQAAVDRVARTGGTVCLGPGVYDVGDGVVVEKAKSVRIRGQGPATVLAGRGAVLTARHSSFFVAERFGAIVDLTAPYAIRLHSVTFSTVRDTVVLAPGSGGTDDRGGAAVALSGACRSITVHRNVLMAARGVDGAGSGGGTGVFAAGLRVEDNLIVGRRTGIDLGGVSAYADTVRIRDNEVFGADAAGIVATGALAADGTLEVCGNTVATGGTGIVVGVDATVDSNRIQGHRRQPGTDGIVVEEGTPAPPGDVRITGNRVRDRSGTGIALRGPVTTFTADHNLLSAVGSGVVVEDRGAAERVVVEDNEITDVATGRSWKAPAFGVVVARSASAAVTGNRVARLAPDLVENRTRVAILALGCADSRVCGNLVADVGPRQGFAGAALGIGVLGPFERLLVGENSVRREPGPEVQLKALWQALTVEAATKGPLRLGQGRAVIPVGDAGQLLLSGRWAFAVPAAGGHVTVDANTLVGGARVTAQIRVAGDVVADANQFVHGGAQEVRAFVVAASSATVTTNRVRGGPRAALVLEVAAGRFAAVGNLAPGGVHLGAVGNGLPAPWNGLNPAVS